MPRCRNGLARDECLAASIGAKSTRRVGIRKLREQRSQFIFTELETLPPITVKMKDDGAGTEDLPDTLGFLAGDAEHHVEQFVQTKGLPNDGPEAYIAGLFFGVANRNGLGQGHGAGRNVAHIVNVAMTTARFKPA